jgi:two-component system, LuxR family, response regulator FixJ
MSAEPTVHVVDDDAAVRRSLERLFDAAGFRVVSYDLPLAFLEAAAGLSAGCVLLDMRMPGMDGLEVQARLIRLGVSLPVIVMTGHGDVQSAVRAMKAGAVDFIEKPFDQETILHAVQAALERGFEGEVRDDPAVAARLDTLSERERQVLEGLVAGHPNKTIAYDLGISPRTVEVYRANLMTKMGARSLSELIRMAIIAKVAPTRRAAK